MMTDVKERKQVKTLDDLYQAAQDRRAVVVPFDTAWHRPRPAAVLLQQQAALVRNLLNLGMYIYERGTSK